METCSSGVIDAVNSVEWKRLIRVFPNADVHYMHGFASAFAGAQLFYYRNGSNAGIFPFRKEGDRVSSLRYGGLLCKKKEKGFAAKVKREFLDYCRNQRVKKIVIRQHPFLRNCMSLQRRETKKEPFVYIPLRSPSRQLLSEISDKHRINIKIAQKNGLNFYETRNIRCLLKFFAFYRDMMVRKGLHCPPLSFFGKLRNGLGDRCRMACITDKKDMLAVSILLLSKPNIYLMYGGMSSEGYKKYAKHFMICQLMKRYKNKGYERLVLGTGAHKDCSDNIFSFKQGFTRTRSSIKIFEVHVNAI